MLAVLIFSFYPTDDIFIRIFGVITPPIIDLNGWEKLSFTVDKACGYQWISISVVGLDMKNYI